MWLYKAWKDENVSLEHHIVLPNQRLLEKETARKSIECKPWLFVFTWENCEQRIDQLWVRGRPRNGSQNPSLASPRQPHPSSRTATPPQGRCRDTWLSGAAFLTWGVITGLNPQGLPNTFLNTFSYNLTLHVKAQRHSEHKPDTWFVYSFYLFLMRTHWCTHTQSHIRAHVCEKIATQMK